MLTTPGPGQGQSYQLRHNLSRPSDPLQNYLIDFFVIYFYNCVDINLAPSEARLIPTLLFYFYNLLCFITYGKRLFLIQDRYSKVNQ